MNRNHIIMGIVIFAAFMIVLLYGSVLLLRQWNNGQSRIQGREPLSRLGYCSAMQTKPCIASFSLDSDQNMVINVLTERSSPDFYLKIKHEAIENMYECQKAKESPTNVSCVGKPMSPGEVLQFSMLTIDGDTPLAEGQFSMIGLALATPEVYSTPTFNPPVPHRR